MLAINGENMKITIYDGADTIGGNKIYVEEKVRGVFLDFGMNFAKYGEFFSEFLGERSSRGIHDPIYLDLIPKLNIYRSDLIPSDVDVSSYQKLNAEAVFLSHAHLDHCGNVGYLDEKIPIAASAVSLATLKAMRDCGRKGISCEAIYYPKRSPAEDDRVLKANIGTKDPYAGRDAICVDELIEEFQNFLCYKPGEISGRAKKIEAGYICCLDEARLPFDVKAFEVDHSIYGATSYIFYGEASLAYTGDIRLHGRKKEKTREFVKEAKNASVLIIEGTRAGREDINVSEKEVYQNCLKEVEKSKGLVIADFSPRNFERLETFKEIAEKTSRQLLVTAKDAYMLHAIELVDGVDRMKGVGIYKELKDKREKWELEVVIKRWGDSYVDPEKIRENQESFILCFSFYDLKHLLDIKPEGGLYIYSSSEAHSEEQEFDFLRLQNWLRKFGFVVKGFEIAFEEQNKLRFVKGYHASGHASKDDLRWMIKEIDPDFLIPVHTENPSWFEENFENARVLKNGESFEF